MTDAQDAGRRRELSSRWREKDEADAVWALTGPPPELISLFERGLVPPGPTLDVGCGFGQATAYLAGRADLAVGMDVAEGAVAKARTLTANGRRPSYLLAGAPEFPFADGSFALVFERGAMQHIARHRWPEYYREVSRILAPGGVFQQVVPERRLPPLMSARGVKYRLRWLTGGSKGMASVRVRQLAPAEFEVVETLKSTFILRNGRRVGMASSLLRKRA